MNKLVKEQEGMQQSGMGRNNFRAVAERAGAIVRIGRKNLYDMDKIFSYLEKNPIQEGVKHTPKHPQE